MRSLGELYDECKEMGVVSSQKAFSRLLGKQPSWYSSTQSRRRVPTTESLVTFYVRLGKISDATKAELDATDDTVDAEALTEGLSEVFMMRSEIWAEIVSRTN